MVAIRGARRYVGDRLIRVAKPHRLLDPAAGPLIAVRLHILTRKTLGGLETDLSSRVLRRRWPADTGTLRGGRGRGVRRRRRARLPRARRHVPGRVHLLRAHGGSRGGQSDHLSVQATCARFIIARSALISPRCPAQPIKTVLSNCSLFTGTFSLHAGSGSCSASKDGSESRYARNASLA